MSSRQTNSAELDTILAAELSTPSESLAASIPPELFRNILAYVGDETRLGYDLSGFPDPSFNPDTRREEVRHLSACVLTCVYWAQLTRERMFQFLILRSSKDMSGLLSFLRAPQSPRIPPICDILRYLDVFYTLGDHPWFHNLAGPHSHYRISDLRQVNLNITGPATPAFVAASTRGSVLHPLFFAVPRVLPVMLPESSNLHLVVKNIHLPNATLLFNLLQDCLSLRPRGINCINLTWDLDPAIQATPSSIGLKYACRVNGIKASRCTDDVLVVAMLQSVPHHEFSQPGRQDLYLNPLETSYLFDAMHATWCGLSPEAQQTEGFHIGLYSNSDLIQENVAVRLPAGTDFCFEWRLHRFVFTCMASRLPHAPANNVCIVTYIIIDLWSFEDHHELRGHMKKPNIDWDTFLHTVRQFPHLRQIAIQWIGYAQCSPRQILVEFLDQLGEVWFGLGELLGLYYRVWDESDEWIQLRLDTTVMDEIKQRREEIKAEDDAEEAASNEPGPSVVEEESESSTHTSNE